MNRYEKAYDVIDTILHLMCGEKGEDGYEPTHDEMVKAMDDLKKLVGKATRKEYSYYGKEYFSVPPNLQNLDFHLTEAPDGKINRKEEREMERTFRLRKKTFRLREESFTFDKKGMILKGEIFEDGQCIFVRAWDIYLNNKDIMSDEEVRDCLASGINYKWPYRISELEPLNPIIPLSKLEYDLLKYYSEHGYQYIARDYDEVLYAYDTKPREMQYEWKATKEITRINFRDLFSFVKWEDEEPCSITYILDNCEVVEDD